MPSIPLVNELGANATKFQMMNDAAPTPAEVKGVTTYTQADTDDMFVAADSRVFVRVRPVLGHEASDNNKVPVVRNLDGVEDSIFFVPKISVTGKCTLEPTPVRVHRTFASHQDTSDVYDTAGKKLVQMAVHGGSSTLICYGQTGSGKTHTTTGLLECMAKDVAAAAMDSVDITVSAFEIKADKCIDLLTRQEVSVCEDTKGEVSILGGTEHAVSTVEEVMHVCSVAIAARSTKATERNAGSSRSHMVVRFIMKQKDANWARPGVLYLADLAGSESTADSAKHDKERLNETKFINTSLMTLKECIRSRAMSGTTTKHVHIPYRQCKLTLLLRDSFELAVKRPTKTVVITCVSPLLRDARHTSGTLRYAGLLVVSPPAAVIASDPNDPSTWDREKALDFLRTASRDAIKNPEGVLPEGDGRALVHIPEAEFIRRAVSICGMAEKNAKMVYSRVWKVMVDARTKQRKAVLSTKPNNEALEKRELLLGRIRDAQGVGQ